MIHPRDIAPPEPEESARATEFPWDFSRPLPELLLENETQSKGSTSTCPFCGDNAEVTEEAGLWEIRCTNIYCIMHYDVPVLSETLPVASDETSVLPATDWLENSVVVYDESEDDEEVRPSGEATETPLPQPRTEYRHEPAPEYPLPERLRRYIENVPELPTRSPRAADEFPGYGSGN